MLRIRIGNSESDLGQFFFILAFREREWLIKIPGLHRFPFSQRNTTHFLVPGSRIHVFSDAVNLSLLFQRVCLF